MKSIFNQLWKEERGAVVTVELLLLSSVVCVGLLTGMTKIRDVINSEIDDLTAAIGSLNQSYVVPAVDCCCSGAWVAGSAFVDEADQCEVVVTDRNTREFILFVIKPIEEEEKGEGERSDTEK